MTTEQKTDRPFGYKEIELDAEEYGLDEPGYIWIKARLKVKDAMNARNIDENDLIGWLGQLIGGWFVKIEGIELPYKPENIEELPYEVLTLVRRTVIDPLQGALKDSASESVEQDSE